MSVHIRRYVACFDIVHGVGSVNLRVFQSVSAYDGENRLVVNDVYLRAEYELPVRLADLVRTNAMALPLRAPASYQVLRHELRLLLSYLPDKSKAPLGLRMGEFRASASHIRRFISESLGRGMLTAAVHDVFHWSYRRRSLDDFDVLPTRLAGWYKSSGIRPDLLFTVSDGSGTWRLAGEARGRSTSRPTGSKASAAQLHRLNELLGWSARHHHHPVTMSWAYAGSTQVNVDLFVVELPDTSPRSPSSIEPTVSRVLRLSPELPVDAILGRSAENATFAFDGLYGSAPRFEEARGPWDLEMRGRWATADLLGPSTTHLLVGILDRFPPTSALIRLLSRQQDQSEARNLDSIQLDVFGRLMLVIARDRNRPPAWSEIAPLLE